MWNPMMGDGVTPEIGVRLKEISPSDDFWHGTVWPIPELALAALVDLGLSDDSIARYFQVGSGKVYALRLRFGMPTEHF